jgi:bifunctional oligoribonuclease and PAP phosphatase NrnA
MTRTDALPAIDGRGLMDTLFAARRVVLSTHLNPDGDALGSELALWDILRAAAVEARIVNADPVPENLSFLDPDGCIFERYDAAVHDVVFAEADALVVMDLNAPGRLGAVATPLLAGPAPVYVIDHHLQPAPFARGYHVRTEASSTAEIVYDLLEEHPGTDIGHRAALGLYAGIMTDTGSFRFERTTPHVHRIAARLLEAGVDPTDVYRRIHDEYPMRRTELLGHVLADIRAEADGTVTTLAVTAELLARTGSSVEDVENLVHYGLTVRGVRATALLTELPDGIKISFRSRLGVTVNDVAAQFGGGGHAFAAGATVRGRVLEDLRADVARLLGAAVEKRKTA